MKLLRDKNSNVTSGKILPQFEIFHITPNKINLLGDCCGKFNSDYCDECLCLDPEWPYDTTTKAPTTKGPTTEAPTTEGPTTAGPTTETPPPKCKNKWSAKKCARKKKKCNRNNNVKKNCNETCGVCK